MLDDLSSARNDDRIPLAMDRPSMSLKRSAETATLPDAQAQELVKKIKADLQSWTPALENAVDVEAVDKSARILHEHLVSAQKSKSGKNDLPDGLLQQLTTFQASTNEFLRQFWASVLPNLAQKRTPQDVKAKAAKAERMKGYLDKSVSRADEIIKANQKYAADIESVLAPIRKATDRALDRWKVTTAQ